MAGNLLPKQEYDAVTIASVTTAGAVASTNTTPVYIPRPVNALMLDLVLSAAATDVGDTLDVKVQTTLDKGTTWVDVLYFTQMLGDGGAKHFIGKIMANTAEALYSYAALTAGNQKNIIGDAWRVNYVTVDANANSAFTFTVTGLPI